MSPSCVHFATRHMTMGSGISRETKNQERRLWIKMDDSPTMGLPPDRCESRVAHCNHDVQVNVEYTILFPFETDPRTQGLSFEIENASKKGLELFRTVGLDSKLVSFARRDGNIETDADEKLRPRLQQLDMKDVDFDVVTPLPDGDQDIQQASTWLISYTASGNINGIRKLLAASADSRRLVQIKDSRGQSLLALAVANGHVDVVEYLLSQGAEVNSMDLEGRTPLMEAVLWGHVKIVDILLRSGAPKTTRDRYGRTAADFAEESEVNDEERHRRHIKYTEDPFVKKRHRRLIKGLLGCQPSKESIRTIRVDDLTDAHFFKSHNARTISFVIPTIGIRITTQYKTAAFLNREDPFPIVAAVSGWTGPDTGQLATPEAGFERLNAYNWMCAARKTAGAIG